METTSSKTGRHSLGDTERHALFLTGSCAEGDVQGDGAAVASGLQEASSSKKPRKGGPKLSGGNRKPRRSGSMARRRSSSGGRGADSDFTFSPYAPMMLDASSQSPRPRRASAPGGPVSKKTKPSPQKTGGTEKLGPTLEQCLVLPVGIDPPLLEGAPASSRTRSKSEYRNAAEARKAVDVDDDDRAIMSSFNYASVGSREEEAKEVAAVERAIGEGTGGIEEKSREDRVGAVVCELSAILEAADAIVVKGAEYMEGGDAGECMEVEDVEWGPAVHFALEDGENARGNAEGTTSGEAAAVDISGELDSNGTAEARPLNADAGDICKAIQGAVDEGYISDGDNPRDTRKHVQETASGEATAVDTFGELESNGTVEARSLSADADDVCEAIQGVVDEVSEAGETIVVTVATAKNIDSVAFRKTGVGGGESESTMVEDEDKDAVEVVAEVRRGSDPSHGERGEPSEEILEADVGIEIQSDSAREPTECREAESSGWLENHDDVHCVPCATDDAATVIPTEDDGGPQTREESVDSEAEAVSSVAAVQQEVDDMELGEAGVAGEGFADNEGQEEEDVEKRGGQMEAEGKVGNSQQVVVFVSSDEGGVVALEVKIKTERRDVPEIEQDEARRAEGAAAEFRQQEKVDEEQGQGRDKATEKVEARMGKDLQVVDVEGEECTVGEGDTRQPCAHSAFLPATGNGEAEPAADTINVQGVDDAFPAAQTEHLPAGEEAAQCANGTDANGDFVLQPSGDCVVDWEALAREMVEEWVFDGSPDEAAVVLPDVAAIDPEAQKEIEAGVSQHVALKTAVIDINASDFDDIGTAATGLKETKQHVEDIEDDEPAPSTGAGDDAAAADNPPVAAAGARPAESTGGNPDPKSSEVPKDGGSLRSGRALVGASSRISTSGQEVHSGFPMSPIRSNSHPLVVEGVNADGAAASGVDARGRGAGAPFVPGSVSPVQRGASIRLERSSATPLGGRDNTRPVQGDTRGGDGPERSQSMDQEREPQNLGENAESACECCIVM